MIKDISKIDKEIEAAKAKIAEYQKRLKELETQRIEAQNAQIVDMVRKSEIPTEELKSIIEKYTIRRKESGDDIDGDETKI